MRDTPKWRHPAVRAALWLGAFVAVLYVLYKRDSAPGWALPALALLGLAAGATIPAPWCLVAPIGPLLLFALLASLQPSSEDITSAPFLYVLIPLVFTEFWVLVGFVVRLFAAKPDGR